MDRKRYGSIMLAASIVYGALIGLLAVLDSGALVPAAIVGGALIGVGWALYGSVTRPE